MSRPLFEYLINCLSVCIAEQFIEAKRDKEMIQPILNRLLQSGKYFSILKFLILQQNISSVWIYGDDNSWYQQGEEMDGVLQHLVGTLPKYVFDLNTTKTICVDNESIKILNIFFVSQEFGSKELNCICPSDYTMVLAQTSSTQIVLPQKLSDNILRRMVFGTINSTTIADLKYFHDSFTLPQNNKPMEDLFITKSVNLNTSDFRIFFQLSPPTSMFSFIDKKFIFFGADAQLAQEVSKKLNATIVIQTNLGFEYPRYEFWFNDTKYVKNSKLLKIRKRILPPNVISDFYQK